MNTSIKVSIVPRLSSYLNELYISHLFVATLLAIVTTASLCLLTQYLRRYSKYQRAAAIEEMVTDLSGELFFSIYFYNERCLTQNQLFSLI